MSARPPSQDIKKTEGAGTAVGVGAGTGGEAVTGWRCSVGVNDGVISRAFEVVGGITAVGVEVTVQADNHTSNASEDRRNAFMVFAPLGLQKEMRCPFRTSHSIMQIQVR
jgi:hypothetical protein